MKTPQHIAFICDGNRRWAKEKHLPEFAGHKHAVEITVEDLVNHAIKLKIPYVTFWFFSTENWNRGKLWTKKFFNLFRQLLPKAQDNYLKKGVKFNFIGNLEPLPSDLKSAFLDWQKKSKNNNKVTATIAFNYGGRDEIIRAINKLLKERTVPSTKKVEPFPESTNGAIYLSETKEGSTLMNSKITEKEFSAYLDTADLPNPDLLIRTGFNNTRLSGFMLWQLAYTQLYFANTLFPDLSPKKLDQAISWWQTQTSNLGK